MADSDDKFFIYDRDSYLDLQDDEGYLEDILSILNDDQYRYASVEELPDDEVWENIYSLQEDDLNEEIHAISRAFDDAFRRSYPDLVNINGEPRYSLLVKGVSTGFRYDSLEPSASYGHEYYYGQHVENPRTKLATEYIPAFESMMNNPNGILKDCDIDSIWEDRSGVLHVRGVHHDGYAEFECKAVPIDTEEKERELLWNASDDDPKTLEECATFMREVWDNGVDARMAEHYGYQWPEKDYSFTYQLLGRLQLDCSYYLGACLENGVDMVAAQKHLWAGNVEDQISKMRELYDSLPETEKPEWLSRNDIDTYETRMLTARGNAASASVSNSPNAETMRSTAADYVRGLSSASDPDQSKHRAR